MVSSILLLLGPVISLLAPSPASAQETVRTRDGLALSARWTVPAGSSRAIALILPGSGNAGLEGDVSSPFVGAPVTPEAGKLSEQIAETLAKTGVASLRYAKRGVEQKEQLINQRFPYLDRDAEDALKLLRQRFPRRKTVLVGLSEGALVATVLANRVPVDGLFLLAPPFRRMDQVLSYQLIGWPMDLVRKRLDPESRNFVEVASIQQSGATLPLADVGGIVGVDLSAAALDLDHDGHLSVTGEILPAYLRLQEKVLGLLAAPELKAWYDSYLALPDSRQLMAHAQAKRIYLYQGLEDSQVNWSWNVEDARAFKVPATLRLFPGVGHCFAPMSGALGTIKHSGPIGPSVLQQLAADVATVR